MLTVFRIPSEIAARLAHEHAARLAAGEDIRALIDEGCMGDVGASVYYLRALRDLDTPAARRLLAEWWPVALDLACDDLHCVWDMMPAEA